MRSARRAARRLLKMEVPEKIRDDMLQQYGLQLPDGCTYKDLLIMQLEQKGKSDPEAAKRARELSTVMEDDSI